MTCRRVLVLTLVALVLVLVGAPDRGLAAPEGQLIWGVHVSLAPIWFDPADTLGMITPFMVLYALHDAMVKPMPGQPTAPSLAESWSVSKDGLVYEFVLRKGARFHNGEPVTAEDVKFSFERYRGTAHKTLKERVAGVEAPDPSRVRFRLKQPWPDFLTFYASASGAGWIVPKKYVEKVGDEGFKKAPVGAGPYKFVSFTPGVELVLEAFDQYWRKTPSVKRLVFRVISDEATRLAALKRGEVDIVYSVRGELAEELQRTAGLTLKPAVIQAPCSFEFFWQPPAPTYNAARAKQLLAEAGYPSGFDAGDYSCDASYSNLAEAVANNLQAAGIRVRLRPLERAAFFSAYSEKKLKNIIQGASGAFGNAATRLEAFVVTGGTYVYGSYSDIDGLFQEQAAELDRKRREAILHRMQQLVHEKVMYAPIWELAFLNGVGPRVQESGLGLISGHAYSAPYEDVTLKGK